MSRYRLVLEVRRRFRLVPDGALQLKEHRGETFERYHACVREHFEDLREIAAWRWLAQPSPPPH